MRRLGTGAGFAARSCPRSFRSASIARFGQDDGLGATRVPGSLRGCGSGRFGGACVGLLLLFGGCVRGLRRTACLLLPGCSRFFGLCRSAFGGFVLRAGLALLAPCGSARLDCPGLRLLPETVLVRLRRNRRGSFLLRRRLGSLARSAP